MDMVWLQRDLGLYVNGLFDTFFASDALHYSSRSLAFLLSKFVNFNADKRYQLADWRIRYDAIAHLGLILLFPPFANTIQAPLRGNDVLRSFRYPLPSLHLR